MRSALPVLVLGVDGLLHGLTRPGPQGGAEPGGERIFLIDADCQVSQVLATFPLKGRDLEVHVGLR